MSSGTRTQHNNAHGKLLRRTENFRAVIPQATTLWETALQVISDNRPDDESPSDEIGEMIRMLMPNSNDVLVTSFLHSSVYPIALLRDVSHQHSCLSMPADVSIGIKDEFKMVKPLQHIAWLDASVYEMLLEDVNKLLGAVASLRSSPVTELVSGIQ